jgi:ABC-type methionine transport system ATPase subunit
VNRPPILLADEPTGNLDPATSVGIMRLLDRINRTGTTILMATHDHAIVDAMRRRVVALDQGRVAQDVIGGRYEDTMVHDTVPAAGAAQAVAEEQPVREPQEGDFALPDMPPSDDGDAEAQHPLDVPASVDGDPFGKDDA